MKNKFDNDLENLIEISKLTIPSLKELRLFGSYGTPRWKEETSDIDIMALLFDENFGAKKDRIYVGYFISESPQRQNLRERISKNLSKEFMNKLSLHIVTINDMNHLIGLDEGRGDIGRNMYKGKLLYRSWKMNPYQFLKYCSQKLCLLKI
ncbi:MAG TPA: nucleotidyltransferase domain-containing protein [Candidatus Nanoarchaeia archaeon]|nr:nucleotidyltransferase domain-containing protein [Candidatus Nanoarchaeia archaeon]